MGTCYKIQGFWENTYVHSELSYSDGNLFCKQEKDKIFITNMVDVTLTFVWLNDCNV